MRPRRDDAASAPERRLFAILAEINNHMITIWNSLQSKAAVFAATRGCDIRRYDDKFTEEEVQRFEAYVEAKTNKGEVFVWSVDITQTSLGWKFQRCVARQTADGEELQEEFKDLIFGTLDELANNYMDLMIEFDESADNFDFRL